MNFCGKNFILYRFYRIQMIVLRLFHLVLCVQYQSRNTRSTDVKVQTKQEGGGSPLWDARFSVWRCYIWDLAQFNPGCHVHWYSNLIHAVQRLHT